MAVKESSDELNPAVVVPQQTVPATTAPWNASDYLALSIATFGVGYLPLIPGTFGSLTSVGIFLLFTQIATGTALVAVVLLFTLAVTFSGIWAASRTEELAGRKDPGKVVVDEVAGQMLALLPLALFNLQPLTRGVIVSFILFRLFDIFKPYPAGRFERLKGGYGIMCDDLVAGGYAAVITSTIMLVFGKSVLGGQ
ncbi:MAG TPA: phosphatidylglycerophosphatase A [Pyrinomonadaceae bacterium]|nr:phosphatidylglycerophosphatase A [Pyrinomonadaceae bacterium]